MFGKFLFAGDDAITDEFEERREAKCRARLTCGHNNTRNRLVYKDNNGSVCNRMNVSCRCNFC